MSSRDCVFFPNVQSPCQNLRVTTRGRTHGEFRAMTSTRILHVRKAPIMSTLVATRHHPAIRAFYQRLVAAGKLKKTLAACMRKLLTT